MCGYYMRLTMAVEEILAYLADQAPDEPLDLTLTPLASQVALDFPSRPPTRTCGP